MRKILIIILSISILFGISACGKSETKRYEAEFLNLFDTITKIVAYTDDKEEFTKYAELIHDNLEEYHQLYDIYNDYDGINNIKTINESAGIAPVKVDKRIIDFLLFAKEEYKQTSGETSVAMGSVLKIWHEHRTDGLDDPKHAKLPTQEELTAASNHMNIEDLIIDKQNATVFLKDSEMRLDVGALAKGYATEQVSLLAIEKGFTSGLISVGGNVRAFGTKPDNVPWNIGVQDPNNDEGVTNLVIVNLKDESLVTSGNYERYYIVEDKQYNHLIDKDTLYPAEYFDSVTIVCQNSGMADALSTAVFNMPYEEGLSFINSLPEVEAMWVFDDGSIRYSTLFEEHIR